MARTMGEGALRLWKTMRDDEAVAAEGGRRDGGGMAAPAPSSSSSLCLQFMDSRSISIASLQVFSFFFLPRNWALGSNLTPDEFLTIFCQFF
jgi:hypothetical protein